jgi:hypothetical protein
LDSSLLKDEIELGFEYSKEIFISKKELEE